MYNKNSQLASLLSSRICHDLANPLGAISNGLELMELSGEHRTPEFDLTANSVQNANAKLAFFRIAFGPASDGDLAGAMISKTLSNVYTDTRCQISYDIKSDTPRRTVKIIFLLIQCFESSLPRGGNITISGDGNNICMAATGTKLNCTNANWDHLLGHTENQELSPSEVHFELARIALHDASKSITLTSGTDSVEVRI
jgi:histidine phosphotransferase ChpT